MIGWNIAGWQSSFAEKKSRSVQCGDVIVLTKRLQSNVQIHAGTQEMKNQHGMDWNFIKISILMEFKTKPCLLMKMNDYAQIPFPICFMAWNQPKCINVAAYRVHKWVRGLMRFRRVGRVGTPWDTANDEREERKETRLIASLPGHEWIGSKITIIPPYTYLVTQGVGNLRPAGHMRPASDFFAAREMSQEKEKKSIYFTSSQKNDLAA